MTARYHNDELPSEELCYANSEPDERSTCGGSSNDDQGFSQAILEDYSPTTQRQHQSDSQDQALFESHHIIAPELKRLRHLLIAATVLAALAFIIAVIGCFTTGSNTTTIIHKDNPKKTSLGTRRAALLGEEDDDAVEFLAEWAAWGKWSGCSPGCGGRGDKRRMRFCLGNGCEGENVQREECQGRQQMCKDCYHLDKGFHEIRIGNDSVNVECESNGWLVFQSRGQFGNPDDYFYRDSDEYREGFGKPGHEFWLGLHHLAVLTHSGRNYSLRVVLTDTEGTTAEANYKKFSIGDTSKFRLSVSGFVENSSSAGDSLTYHDGRAFGAKDNSKCARDYKGAWWYFSCHNSNLNGLNLNSNKTRSYADGIIWKTFTGNYNSLSEAKMMIKPQA